MSQPQLQPLEKRQWLLYMSAATVAPTEEPVAPTEEPVAPTEEPVACKEEPVPSVERSRTIGCQSCSAGGISQMCLLFSFITGLSLHS